MAFSKLPQKPHLKRHRGSTTCPLLTSKPTGSPADVVACQGPSIGTTASPLAPAEPTSSATTNAIAMQVTAARRFTVPT